MSKEVPYVFRETTDSAFAKMFRYLGCIFLTDLRLCTVRAFDIAPGVINQRLSGENEILQMSREFMQKVMKRFPVIEIAKFVLAM